MAPHFPTHGRGGAAQLPADRPQGHPPGHTPGDDFTLGEGQGLVGPLARYRRNPPGSRHDVPHHHGNPPQGAADRIQRFAVSPAAPQLRFLRRRQTWTTSLHHETSSLGSCCIDRLNSPR